MAPNLFTTMVMLSAIVMPTIATAQAGGVDDDSWLSSICQDNNNDYKAVKLHFYVQDALSGPNATVWEVSRASITGLSPTQFGQVRVLDNKVSVGPDPSSRELGRVQGVITSSDLVVTGIHMNLNFVFTSGKYNGSTLTLLGRNEILNVDRELPVVAGTGVFRMARGYSISNTYSYDPVAIRGVLEYTLYVTYPQVKPKPKPKPKVPTGIRMVGGL